MFIFALLSLSSRRLSSGARTYNDRLAFFWLNIFPSSWAKYGVSKEMKAGCMSSLVRSSVRSRIDTLFAMLAMLLVVASFSFSVFLSDLFLFSLCVQRIHEVIGWKNASARKLFLARNIFVVPFFCSRYFFAKYFCPRRYAIGFSAGRRRRNDVEVANALVQRRDID